MVIENVQPDVPCQDRTLEDVGHQRVAVSVADKYLEHTTVDIEVF